MVNLMRMGKAIETGLSFSAIGFSAITFLLSLSSFIPSASSNLGNIRDVQQGPPYLQLIGNKPLGDTICLNDFKCPSMRLKVVAFHDSTVRRPSAVDSMRVISFDMLVLPKQGRQMIYQYQGNTIPYAARANVQPGSVIIIQSVRISFRSRALNLAPLIIRII